MLWGSVITGLIAGWSLPISYVVTIPLGLALWAVGFLYNLFTMGRFKRGRLLYREALTRRGYQRIFARTVMNLGVAMFFRSWLAILAAFLLIPLYSTAARRRRLYLDYIRTGMLSDAFPDRIGRR